MKLHVFRIANGAAPVQDAELPKRLKLLNWGDNPAIRGINARIGRHTLSAMPQRMSQMNLDRVALDFEHNTVKGTPAYEESEEPRTVAAFGTPNLIEGDGLYLDDLIYTPQGKSHALNYVDLSPAVHIDPKTGEVDFLHSVALTRAGAVVGLSFFSVEAGVARVTTRRDEMEWRDFVAGFVGLPTTATDEELQAGMETRIAALASATVTGVQESITTLSATVEGLKPGDGHEAEITALSTTVASLKDELGSVSGEVVALRRQGICEQAAREGKVIPLSAEQIARTEPETLAEMVGKLTPTVPVDQRTPANVQALSAAAATTALKTVAERCGLTVEQVQEANKK